MAIYLGHTTAQRILESKLVRELDPMLLKGPINCVSNKQEVTKIINARFGDSVTTGLTSPFFAKEGEKLDLVVASQDEKRRWKGVNCHVFHAGLPQRSFLQLKEDVLVACPELCFLQRSAELSLVGAIKLAMSFCGLYRLEGTTDKEQQSIFDRSPIMTVEGALTYLEGLKGIPGLETARRALSYTLPNSGSPMETAMVIPFYLPYSLGGFGLPRPEMNMIVPLDERGQAICGKQYCRGDAGWPVPAPRKAPILEYQSKEQHDKAEQYGKDYARQLAMQSQGHDVRFVTMEQVSSIEQMTELARVIRRHTRARVPEKVFEQTEKRLELLREVVK